MVLAPASSDLLAARMARLRARYPDAAPEMVADVVRAMLASMRGDLTAPDTALLAEVEELGRTIASAKQEIAALGVDEITDSHIPSATDELDAIVAHTASATESILDVCEALDDVGAGLQGAPAERLQDATTRIYEACSFQDITGQRISKIVATLKAIEGKVAHIVATFSPGGASLEDLPPPPPEAALLNGPQLPAHAMDQADIDRLLADF
jgi:chemotaxis protein CheZ